MARVGFGADPGGAAGDDGYASNPDEIPVGVEFQLESEVREPVFCYREYHGCKRGRSGSRPLCEGSGVNNLLAAIMAKTVASALSTYVGGRIYLDEALPGAVYPYVVLSIVSDTPEDTFSAYLDEIMVQFSLFSVSRGATEITTMYSYLKALFDDAVLTVTGYTHIWMVRQNLATMLEEITTAAGAQTLKHWAADYSVMLQKT